MRTRQVVLCSILALALAGPAAAGDQTEPTPAQTTEEQRQFLERLSQAETEFSARLERQIEAQSELILERAFEERFELGGAPSPRAACQLTGDGRLLDCAVAGDR